MASYASQRRAALSTMISSTGWISVGEVAIARRIALVAVFASRDSISSRLRVLTSSKSRTFSMAMTAWSAKVCTSSISRELTVINLGSTLLERIHPDLSLRSSGTPIAGFGGPTLFDPISTNIQDLRAHPECE